MAAERPTVSVIVPFTGSDAALDRLVAALASLRAAPGDELIVADNTPRAPVSRVTRAARVRVHRAAGVRAAGFARNCGARAGTGEWLVFVDADTELHPTLLDAYFDPTPAASTAVLAGGIADVTAAPTLPARHSAARRHMSQAVTVRRTGSPYAQTANCAIRRSAFAAVGGFDETIRAGEDADLCFRLARAGWTIEERPGALVGHRSRATLRALLTQLARHGSGAAWLNRRYPGEFPPPSPRDLAGRLRNAALTSGAAMMRGEREPAAFALLDLLSQSAFDGGRLLSNRARES